MNEKISVFGFCVEAIICLLLYNLHDCTFKKFIMLGYYYYILLYHLVTVSNVFSFLRFYYEMKRVNSREDAKYTLFFPVFLFSTCRFFQDLVDSSNTCCTRSN